MGLEATYLVATLTPGHASACWASMAHKFQRFSALTTGRTACSSAFSGPFQELRRNMALSTRHIPTLLSSSRLPGACMTRTGRDVQAQLLFS